MILVLDTNVLVSALLTSSGPPARILDMVLAGAYLLAYDDRLLAEYTEVLERPRLGFAPELTRVVLDHLRLVGLHVAAPPLMGVDPPDPTDRPFAEVALAAPADALITGTTQHLAFLSGTAIRVVSPADFWDLVQRAKLR